jgi:hypothetical protein
VDTNVLKAHPASILKVYVTSTLKIEAALSFETLISARCHSPEYYNMNIHRRGRFILYNASNIQKMNRQLHFATK